MKLKRLPDPQRLGSPTDIYLSYILAELQGIRQALEQPLDAELVAGEIELREPSEDELRELLQEVKGVGPATANEIIGKLKE
jgi:hypothetical protein